MRFTPSSLATVKLARKRAMQGHSTVFFLGEDAKEPDSWGNANKAINSLSTVMQGATGLYATNQARKLSSAAADLEERKVAAAQKALKIDQQIQAEADRAAALKAVERPQGLPSWVLPVAIGGVLLAAVGGYLLLNKKAVS
jgi:hypothetical protein